MNPTTQTYQDSLPTQLAKEGVAIAEAPLKKILADRAALVKSLYGKQMTEAAFNRAKAEEEMIKSVASYNVSVEALLEAQTQEMQRMRERLQELAQKDEEAKDLARKRLKLEGLGLVVALRLAHQQHGRGGK